jgi:signal transduction histidine kinase
VTALAKLFRSTAFKLALAYLLLSVGFAGAMLVYVAWNATQLIDEQIRSTLEAEANGLVEQYNEGGIRSLVITLDARARRPGASLFLLTTFSGARLAGNVGAVEPGTLTREGTRDIDYVRSDDTAEGTPHRAKVSVIMLPGGFRLLVGRDLEERERLGEVIRRAIWLTLAVVTFLACVGGWFITRRVLKRVDAMTATTRTIMAGDLSGRLPSAGTGDELDRLADNLNVMLDRIGELMAGLKEVSDNIAHDLKTPLTRLRNRAEEALRTARSGDDYSKALEATIAESDDLIRVFDALLMIARLEAGGAKENLADYDVGEVARGVAELYEPLAEEAGVQLVVSADGPLLAHGSRELLGQALSNLVDNAIKYGAPAKSAGVETPAAAVTVAARRQGPLIEVAVADHGPGIAEADRARAIERFARLESARTRPGFGLGLSLASAVARLHGGALRLEDNAPGLRAVLALPGR